MQIEKLNPWLSFLGNVGVLAGIIFLILEIQQTNRIAEAELSRAVFENSGETRALLSTHPEIWAKGASGEPLNETEMAVFEVQIESQWARAASSTSQRRRLNPNSDPNIALHRLAWTLHKNPGARAYWEVLMDENEIWRNILITGERDPYVGIVRSDLQKLDQELAK